MISVFVGSGKKEYIIHEKLLCDSCGVFQDEQYRKIKDVPGVYCEEEIFMLEDESTDTFDVFVAWLYSRNLERQLSNRTELEDLLRLYQLAHWLECNNFINDVINCVQDLFYREAYQEERGFLELDVLNVLKFAEVMKEKEEDKEEMYACTPLQSLCVHWIFREFSYGDNIINVEGLQSYFKIHPSTMNEFLELQKRYAGKEMGNPLIRREKGIDQCTFHDHSQVTSSIMGECPDKTQYLGPHHEPFTSGRG